MSRLEVSDLKNYYKILEIEFNADNLSIKKAYRKLALRYHPDKNKENGAAQKFIEITEAYEVLINPIKRQVYDKLYKETFKTSYLTDDIVTTNFEYSDKQNQWQEYGRKKAQEYAAMPFEDFAKKLLKEISIGANYIPNAIAILIVAIMIISMLSVMPKTAKDSMGMGTIIILIIAALSYLAYRLFKVARNDYIQERKQKIINKNK